MKETKVRRKLYFNDLDMIRRFIMLYEDDFQTELTKPEKFWGSSVEGYEYEFVFHMSKENFDKLKKLKIVRKKKGHYKRDLKKFYGNGFDIWVLC